MTRNHAGTMSVPPVAPKHAEQIRSQLERLLRSPQFRNTQRCQRLLREITKRALVGDTAGLKERVLGINVFGRAPDYDSSLDPVVRATAAEVRKKLAQYYLEPQHQPELRIELLPGGYVPEFQRAPEKAEFSSDQIHAVVPFTAKGRRVRHFPLYAAAFLAAVAAGVLLIGSHWKGQPVDRFWAPVLRAPGDVLVSMGQPVVYNLRSAEAQDRIQSMRDRSTTPAPIAGEQAIPLADLVVLWDRYVALGDAVCLTRITGLLEKHGKRYRIRGERSTSFPDLSETAAVLVGAFDNQWTLNLVGQSRFTFASDGAGETDMVRDRYHPQKTDWKLERAWPDWDIQNDFAIVSRVLDVNTGRPIVVAAGITQFGTAAAGEFLTDSDCWAEALRRLPRNWDKMNVQIVLRVPVVHEAPGRPQVLETSAW